MKKVITLLTIILFCISCNKDDDTPISIPDTPDDSFFKAKIDGVEYKANGNQAVVSRLNNSLTISSLIPDGRNFYLELGSNSPINEIGTYVFPPSMPSYFLRMDYSENSTLYFFPVCSSSNVGELTITSITENEVTGTFSFNAKNSDCSSNKNISEGSFKLKFNHN